MYYHPSMRIDRTPRDDENMLKSKMTHRPWTNIDEVNYGPDPQELEKEHAISKCDDQSAL